MFSSIPKTLQVCSFEFCAVMIFTVCATCHFVFGIMLELCMSMYDVVVFTDKTDDIVNGKSHVVETWQAC